ncbi:MAG: aspartate 1-decarboxylase [Nitrospirae bacterium]|nr:aspartate 1-decarboxylase [Nitrospirota bacterium]MBF0534830.1 aspartate 1-decarboxylase [Nitrospirota bacterium]MBF0616504.1 aspartate 1-decarboxylase [Nitrospirota bacterium]
MYRCMLRAKLHMARVTEANILYSGSLTVDEDLMDLAGMYQYEKVLISNVNNGQRFETYLIPGERGSGEICLNGAAARRGVVGDKIIIFSFAYISEDEISKSYKPNIVVLSDDNKPTK